MIRSHLQTVISQAVAALVAEGKIPAAEFEPVELTDPRSPEHGDYATNFAMVNSKKVGMNPRALGEALSDALSGLPDFEKVEVAGPGFLNLRLKPEALSRYVADVLAAGTALSHSPCANPQRINVEFVSVNPNGPITVASGRGAAFGSALCRVLKAVGHEVHREYYINDGVNSTQMQLFAESVQAYVEGKPLPEKGYKGDYVQAVAEEVSRMLDAASIGVPQAQGLAMIDLTSPDCALSLAVGIIDNLLANAKEAGGDLILLNRKSDLIEVKYRIAGAIEQVATLPTEPGEEILRAFVAGSGLSYHDATAGKPFEVIVRGSRCGDALVKVEHGDWRKDGTFLIHLPIEPGVPAHGIGWFQSRSQELMLKRQRADLATFGVEFDTWFSEQSLHEAGLVDKCIAELTAKGVADENPYRTVLKMGKKGEVLEVNKEEQPVETDDGPNEEAEIGDQKSEIGDRRSDLSDGSDKSDESDGSDSSAPQTPDPKPQTPTLWLRSTKFADDMDRVIRRKDGRLTYIASDVAYHKDKFNRPENADKLITVLGPDHHGYINRLRAVVAALLESNSQQPTTNNGLLDGTDAEIFKTPNERDACRAALADAEKKLEVVIFQLVRFLKDGKQAPMRKRDGNIYALIDLIDELGKTMAPNGDKEEQQRIGRDVARFFYLMRSHDSNIDFDLDLATKQSDENPVFYAQYAHARICSVMRKAAEGGLGLGDAGRGTRDAGSDGGDLKSEIGNPDAPNPKPETRNPQSETPNPKPPTLDPSFALLVHPKELALIKKIVDLPYEVRRCAEDYGVHRLTTFAVELARTYHGFYDSCRVISPENPELSRARLALCEATRLALKSVFDLLGISAPERMERAEATG